MTPAQGERGQELNSVIEADKKCQHNALHRCKERNYTFLAYVCGNCAKIFEVKPYENYETTRTPEPMFDRRKPWGLRDRQA